MSFRGIGMAFALPAVLTACFTDTDLTNRPLFDNGVNVFEAQVIDGHTGTAIANATLTIQVGKHVLAADVDNGFYTVYGIPYGTFRVNVTVPGYNIFQAMKPFTSSSQNARLSRGDPLVYYFNNVIVFPLGDVPADVKVSVYDNGTGAPVPGATVAAALDQLTTLVNVTDPLPPNVGNAPTTLVTTTDAQGKASFPAAQLIMGATYDLHVFGALDPNGVYLVPVTNRTVRIGYDVQEIVVFLAHPTLMPVALLANNEEADALSATLQITFPYAVELCSVATAHTWFNSTSSHTGTNDTDNDGTVTTPALDNPVSATLSVNDTVLTLAFATENDDAGDELYVTFNGVTIKPKGAADASCTSLTAVGLRSLTGFPNLDTEIHVRDIP